MVLQKISVTGKCEAYGCKILQNIWFDGKWEAYA